MFTFKLLNKLASPPTNTVDPIPTPPLIVSAPSSFAVLCVVFDMLVTPETISVPLISVFPSSELIVNLSIDPAVLTLKVLPSAINATSSRKVACSSTFKVSSKSTAPPTNNFLAIAVPPSIMTDAFEMLVASV